MNIKLTGGAATATVLLADVRFAQKPGQSFTSAEGYVLAYAPESDEYVTWWVQSALGVDGLVAYSGNYFHGSAGLEVALADYDDRRDLSFSHAVALVADLQRLALRAAREYRGRVVSRPATVDIADVTPEATQIQARDLEAGDKVFDTFGGTHELVCVRRLRNGLIHARRDDQATADSFEPAELITVIKKA